MSQTSLDNFFEVMENPKESEKTLIVFTDGAAKNNGKSSCSASFATVWPYHRHMDFGSALAKTDVHTNNRGELYAVIHALHQADELDTSNTKTLIVYTDSQLLIHSMTIWLNSWKRNNWKKSDGKQIANKDLIMQLDDLLQKRQVVFRHVRAHTKAATWEATYNDLVDQLARSYT